MTCQENYDAARAALDVFPGKLAELDNNIGYDDGSMDIAKAIDIADELVAWALIAVANAHTAFVCFLLNGDQAGAEKSNRLWTRSTAILVSSQQTQQPLAAINAMIHSGNVDPVKLKAEQKKADACVDRTRSLLNSALKDAPIKDLASELGLKRG